MNEASNSKLKPALLAGGAMAVVSAFQGLVQLAPGGSCLSVCCCGLLMCVGLLATYLYFKDLPPQPQTAYGDGALLGLMSGAIGAVLSTLISIPVHFLSMAVVGEQLEAKLEEARRAMEQADIPPAIEGFLTSFMSTDLTVTKLLFGFAFSLVLYSIFGAIGGLIGAAVFGKKGKPAVPPPPPMTVNE